MNEAARDLPPRLYKYVTRAVFLDHFLTEGSTRWSAPVEFNDPFDCRIDPMVDRFSPETRQEVRRVVREVASDYLRGKSLVPEVFSNAIASAGNGAGLEKGLERFADIMCEHFAKPDTFVVVQAISRAARVLCLSEQPLSIPMWSHYADKHKGVVIGFHTMELVREFADMPAALHAVQYVDEYPRWAQTASEVNAFLRSEDPPGLDVARAGLMFRTKSNEWKYEREWRFVYIPYGDPRVACKAETAAWTRPVSVGSVAEFVLGAGASEEEIEGTLRAIQESPFRHVATVRALKQPDTFALRKESVARVRGG